MADPTLPAQGGVGPSSSNRADQSLPTAAILSGRPEPIDTATEETHAAVSARLGEEASDELTLADRSMRLTPEAGEVTRAHDPDRTGTGDGTSQAQSVPEFSLRGAPIIPGYEIESELGRGGMGVVYKARTLRLNRSVALKMILAGEHAGVEAAARFLAEAEAVAKLQHPNIIQIFHVDEHAGHAYFEMEYVGGGSLADRLDGIPCSPGEAARLVETLARAITEAHRLGVVHRDLKPGNILLTTDGTPKIADFGLAKLLNVESGMTRTDSVLGSPSYMAPEQAEGKTKEVGPAADLYALGAILYEQLTGRPPFRGATVLDTLQQVKTAEPVPPSRLVLGLPRDVETIALKCLEKEPEKRYASAEALADDLRRFQRGEPIQARSISKLERSWRWCRRNPAQAGLAATAVALLVAIVGSAAVASLQFRLIAHQEKRLKNEAELRAIAETRAKEKLEASLYFHRIALAHRELSADNLGRAQELLEECPPRLRGWEWDYLNRLCRVEPMTLRGSGKGTYGVAFSPDGKHLATANGDGTVGLLDSETGEGLLTLRGHKDFVFSVAFSPDGKHLASASADRTVKVWDLASGGETLGRAGHPGVFSGAAYSVAFSPDGQRLAYGLGRDIIIWEIAGEREILRLRGHERYASGLAFSPDGRLLASGSFKGLVRIWDALTGRLVRAIPGHDDPITAVVFRSDGRRLATAGYDRLVKIWDVKTGEPLLTLSGHSGQVVGLAFSADGRRLASCGEDKTVKVWDADTGQETLNLRGHTAWCQCVAFSPDGRRLASASLDATVRVWDATPLKGNEGRESLTLRHGQDVESVAFSPDGRRLASGSYDKTVKLWDATSGILLHTLSDGGHVFGVAFRPPDGECVASISASPVHAGVLRVWNGTSGQRVFSIPVSPPTYSVAFSPDGRYLLMESPDHTIRVLDARTGLEMGILGRHTQDVWCLKFSPDGRRLASASNDWTVKLWDATRLLQEQEPLLTIPLRVEGFCDRLTFSADGRHLISGGEEHSVKVWDAATGREIQTLRGHSGDVFCVASSPDGRWFASAGEDTTVRIWDATAGTLLQTLRGHTGLVCSLAFSPDSRHLVSGSRDRTVKVWDLALLSKKPRS